MNRTQIVAVAAAVLLVASAAAAEVQTREIEYKEGEAVLLGLIAWDDASKGLRPGVLVVHEWWEQIKVSGTISPRPRAAGLCSLRRGSYFLLSPLSA